MPSIVRRPPAVPVALMTAFLAFAVSPGHAADQTVLGKAMTVKDAQPGVDSALRSVVVLGQELPSDNTVVGNPVADGATVEIIANGGAASTQVFTLPSGAAAPGLPGWKALGNP